jgi:hypothetical protein
MLRSDSTELYDLPEAGALLYADPVRLLRLARGRRIPSAWVEGGLGLPVAWVEAEAGRSAQDAEALARYWLERLAPASGSARRPARDLTALGNAALLAPAEAAAALFADDAALARLEGDGTLPPLRVDGTVRHDARLAERVAAEDGDPEAARMAAERRAEVERLARFEYVTDLDAGATAAGGGDRPAPARAVAVAPRAWTLPADLERAHGDGEAAAGDGPAPRLIEAPGYEVESEDP